MNVQLGRGKVHYAGEADGFMPSPKCGGNRGCENYRTVSAEVTCKNCLVILAKEAAEAEPAETTEDTTEETSEVKSTVTVDGQEYAVTVYQATTYQHPNTWEIHVTRGEDSRFFSFPKGEKWEAARFYNVTLWGTPNAPLSHPRSLADAIREAFSPEGTRTRTRITSDFSEVAPDAAESATVSHEVTDHQGEIMTDKTTTPAKLDVTAEDGKAALEQIDANIERVRSLAEAENLEGIEELAEETEGIISALSGKGSIAIKKEKRDAFKGAATVTEKPKAEVARKAAEGVVVAKTWDQYEGTQELAQMGAEKLAEGVRLNLKASNVAMEVAAVAFDMVTRIPNKDDNPDLMVASDAAKKAGTALIALAGEGFEHTWDNEQALKKLTRSVQDYRSDVRAAWLRSLDEDTEEAAERRARVAKILEGKPEDVKASEFVAKAYGTSTIGQAERKRLAYQEKQKAKELAAAGKDTAELTTGEGGEGDGEGEGSDTTPVSPDEAVTKIVDRLWKDTEKADPDAFDKASDAVKKAQRERLEKIKKAITDMIAATL
jgi:hypothetical protein